MKTQISKPSGLRRIVSALRYALQGLSALYKREPAFRQEVFLFIPLSVLAYFIATTAMEMLLLVGVLWCVLIVEVINTAIEVVVDRIDEQTHPLSGLAKDLGALAVLLSIIGAFAVWMTVILSR